MNKIQSKIKPIIFEENKVLILDQRLLPFEKKYLEITSYKEVINAIKSMAIRGAPLIGIIAGYGMALGAQESIVGAYCNTPLQEQLKIIADEIKNSRPTAINLKWAVDLILNDIECLCHPERSEGSHSAMRSFVPFAKAQGPQDDKWNEIINTIKKRAIWIHEDDANRCQKIGENGTKLIPQNAKILTICNTGSLATGGIGTAFGVILASHLEGKNIKVFASETRPRQQGARLTTFECIENGIDCTLIADTACGYLMQKKEIDLVITGADRIASNGDSANKIGTYQLAILAKEHNIPFYIAAPLSTFDLKIKSGDEIPIEERNEKEVREINEKLICQKEVKVKNPAFDITPAKYITGIITEKGILKGNYKDEIQKVFNAVSVA